jgi:hypothetical protein
MTQEVLPKYFANLTNIEQHMVVEQIYPGCSMGVDLHCSASVHVRLEAEGGSITAVCLQSVQLNLRSGRTLSSSVVLRPS